MIGAESDFAGSLCWRYPMTKPKVTDSDELCAPRANCAGALTEQEPRAHSLRVCHRPLDRAGFAGRIAVIGSDVNLRTAKIRV